MNVQTAKDVLEAVLFLAQEVAVLDLDKALRLIGLALAQLQELGRDLLVDAILWLLDALPE